jgi:hypothetical protein
MVSTLVPVKRKLGCKPLLFTRNLYRYTVVEGLAGKAGEQFAFDSYRRFLDMYGNVVMGIEHKLFEHEIDALKKEVGLCKL